MAASVPPKGMLMSAYARQAPKPRTVPRPDGLVSPTTAKSPLRSNELSELSEQAIVVSALKKARMPDGGRIHFFAVPNGHVRSKRQHIQAKLEGVSAGVVDLVIVTPPPADPSKVATALEMKRADARPSDLRDEQVKWMMILGENNWATVVGLGAADALVKLRVLGYPV